MSEPCGHKAETIKKLFIRGKKCCLVDSPLVAPDLQKRHNFCEFGEREINTNVYLFVFKGPLCRIQPTKCPSFSEPNTPQSNLQECVKSSGFCSIFPNIYIYNRLLFFLLDNKSNRSLINQNLVLIIKHQQMLNPLSFSSFFVLRLLSGSYCHF